MQLTEDEKKLVGQFIYTSLQQYSQSFIVDTFVSLLENDAATVAYIKQQLSLFLTGSSLGVQQKIDNLEAQKLEQEARLQAEKDLMDSFKVKIEWS